jgi:hypothetical protein
MVTLGRSFLKSNYMTKSKGISGIRPTGKFTSAEIKSFTGFYFRNGVLWKKKKIVVNKEKKL